MSKVNDLINKSNKIIDEVKNVFLEEDGKIYHQGKDIDGYFWKDIIINEKYINFINVDLHYLKIKRLSDNPNRINKNSVYWTLDVTDNLILTIENKITDMIGRELNESDISVLASDHVSIPKTIEVK